MAEQTKNIFLLVLKSFYGQVRFQNKELGGMEECPCGFIEVELRPNQGPFLIKKTL